MTNCISCGKELTESRAKRQYKRCIPCQDGFKLEQAKIKDPTTIMCRGCKKMWSSNDLSPCTCANRANTNRDELKKHDILCRGIIAQSKSTKGEPCKFKARREDFNGYCDKHQAQAFKNSVPADEPLCSYRNTCRNVPAPGRKWCEEHLQKDREKTAKAKGKLMPSSIVLANEENDLKQDECIEKTVSIIESSNTVQITQKHLIVPKIFKRLSIINLASSKQDYSKFINNESNTQSLEKIPLNDTKTYIPVKVLPKTFSEIKIIEPTKSFNTTFKILPPKIIPMLNTQLNPVKKLQSASINQILDYLNENIRILHSFLEYKAQKDHKEFNISIGQISVIHKLPCSYCGDFHNTRIYLKNENEHYNVSNLHQICDTCYYMKEGFNEADFLIACQAICFSDIIVKEIFLNQPPKLDDYIQFAKDNNQLFTIDDFHFKCKERDDCQLCKRSSDKPNLVVQLDIDKYYGVCFRCLKLMKNLDLNLVLKKCSIIVTRMKRESLFLANIELKEIVLQRNTIIENLCKSLNHQDYLDSPKFLYSSSMYYISKMWTGLKENINHIKLELEICNRNPILIDLWKWYRINLCKLVSIYDPKVSRDSHYILVKDRVTKDYVGLIGLDWYTNVDGNSFKVNCISAIGEYKKYDRDNSFLQILKSRELITYINKFCNDKIMIERKNHRAYDHLVSIPKNFLVRSFENLTQLFPGSVKLEIAPIPNLTELTSRLKQYLSSIDLGNENYVVALEQIGLPYDLLGYDTIDEYSVPIFNDIDMLMSCPIIEQINKLPSICQYNTIVIDRPKVHTFEMLIQYSFIDDNLMDNTTVQEILYQPDKNERWVDIPDYLINHNVGYTISDKGDILFNYESVSYKYSSYNKHGKYKTVKIEDQQYYVHRLVYFSFNQETPLHRRVLFKNYFCDSNGFLDCNIINLICPKSDSWEIPQTVFSDKPLEYIHPIYGLYFINKWYPVRAHYTPKDCDSCTLDYSDTHEIMIVNAELPYIVRRKNKDNYIKIFGNQDPYISLTNNGITIKFQLTHVVLSSIFPLILPQAEVDHLDRNPFNNYIDNFEWVSRTENAVRNRLNQIGEPRNGIAIEIFNNFGIRERFISIQEAARAIHFVTKNLYNADAEQIATHLADCISNVPKRLSVRGFSARRLYDFEDLPDEIWLRYPNDPRYLVSNKGRVKGKGGNLLRQRYGRNGPYSDVCIKGTRYVHMLVWITYNGPIPEDMYVLHNDNAPKYHGIYRNWLEDLSLGTQSKNNLQYHKHIRL